MVKAGIRNRESICGINTMYMLEIAPGIDLGIALVIAPLIVPHRVRREREVRSR